METLQWVERGPGIWKTSIGTPEDLDPLSLLGISPRREALQSLGAPPFPLDQAAITTEVSPRRTVIRLPLTADEHIYGLGLQFMRVNHRGRTRYLRVNSDPRQDTGETHAPVPLYLSSEGYGVLVNTARIVTIYCGSTLRRNEPVEIRDRNTDPNWKATPLSELVEIVVPAAGTELYVLAGLTLLGAVQRYNLLCGGGALPPRWGLGFWHRVPLPFSDEEVIQEAREFRQRGFPCDVIGLEPGWHSHSYPCTYEWSPERFPRPAEFVERMAQDGFRINLWEHAWVHPSARIHQKLEPLSGSHTVWGGLAPDYTLEQAQGVLKEQHDAEHLAIGVSGYKLDECDGSELTGASWMFPAHASFPSGHDGEQLRQVYGLLLQKMTTDLFRQRNRRTYGLVRAATTGASSFPSVLYSDLYDHRQFVRALCNASFSGLLWTPEIRGARSAEEWVRRMQVVCFSPLAMLNAWSDRTKPWSYPEVEHIILKYLQLRMRLMPYFYSAFARYHDDGTPPFRAMPLEFGPHPTPAEAASLDADDQYMAGDTLLVAPLFAGELMREVFLPAGVWYDFETGERYEGDRKIRVSPGLDRIPVFARDGAIIPMMPPLDHAPRPGEQVPLEVRYYGTAPGRFRLYDDDGETYAYEQGAYRWWTLEAQVGADGQPRVAITRPEDGWASSYADIRWRFMTTG